MDKKPTLKKRNARSGLKIWLGVILLLVLVGIACWWFLTPHEPPKPTFQTVSVTQGPIVKTVAATGKVTPNFEVEIKAKGSGKIIKLPYDVSDYVLKGALLVQLDPVDATRVVSQSSATLTGSENKTSQAQLTLKLAQKSLLTDLARAKADLQAAQAKQVQNQAQKNRLQQLVNSHYISQQEYEAGLATAAQADTDAANARIRFRELQNQQINIQAQASAAAAAAADTQNQSIGLAIARQQLTDTKVYAPISGVVTTRTGQIGQIIASGISNVGGGTAIMTLADMSRIFVLASVDESDIGQVKEGQSVKITADSFPGRVFQGHVVRIAPEGVEDANVVTFEVKIEADGANKNLLMSNMTTNVEIMINNKQNALTIPVESVLTHDGQSWVRVLGANGRPHRRPVTLGINNGTLVEVVDGLSEGDKILSNAGQGQSHWRHNPGDKKGADAGNGGGSHRGGGGGGQMMMMRGMMH